ncbi:MAG TPA: hypothetical protein VNE00_29505 [Paraburkholderia sp.]|jgi:hypothetical protein|nr:hypothetical protein [Paraburkholderia sp.]
MLTIAQQRHSLTVTEARIARAMLDVSRMRNLIQIGQLDNADALLMRKALAIAERALEDLSQIKGFLTKAIEVKERDLARLLGARR